MDFDGPKSAEKYVYSAWARTNNILMKTSDLGNSAFNELINQSTNADKNTVPTYRAKHSV